MQDLNTGFVGVTGAAKALGCSRPTVRKWIRQGRLPGIRTPSGHAVAVVDLAKFQREREAREEETRSE